MATIDKWLSSELDNLVALRRDLHAHPELGMGVHRTAALVAEELTRAGISVTCGIGGTGVVGTISGRKEDTCAIGLRADMDALAIHETTGLSYASSVDGVMHACGHDGHTTMLLGAARYLAENPDFSGQVHVIFQPAEETLTGATTMIRDGLFDRFPCNSVYGLHNTPGMPVGKFGICDGPMMAAADSWTVNFYGRGGHGGLSPHLSDDVTYVQAQFVLGLQGIVGRYVPPMETAVISVGYIGGGAAASVNVIPSKLTVAGTIRCFSHKTRELLQSRISELANTSAACWGAKAEFTVKPGIGALINDRDRTQLSVKAAASVVGMDNVNDKLTPTTGSEDFAAMLEARPGAFMRIGNGFNADGGIQPVHTPGYDFNDSIIPLGVRYWAALVSCDLAPAE